LIQNINGIIDSAYMGGFVGFVSSQPKHHEPRSYTPSTTLDVCVLVENWSGLLFGSMALLF
jgi:hypothetical protein